MKKALVLLLCGLVCASCGKKEGSSSVSQSQKPLPQGTVSTDLRSDYSKPYLTDEKMSKFIDSMKEEHNPFEVVFKEGGQMRGVGQIQAKVDEFNSFARKYGYHDYEDYTAVWGRIVVGEMQLLADETFRKGISDAEAELKKPNLDPEMRKAYEAQIESYKEGLENSGQSKLNDADLALIKKYQPQLDEAEKKYRKQAG